MPDFFLATICALLTSGLGRAEAGWSAPLPPYAESRAVQEHMLAVTAHNPDTDRDRVPESSAAWTECASEEEDLSGEDDLLRSPAQLLGPVGTIPRRLRRLEQPTSSSALSPKRLSILRC